MPKTKRNKVVSLTKTTRKTREHKTGLIERVREAAEAFPYIWIIHADAPRAKFLQEVRDLWKGSKIFYGKVKVLALALGDSEESELRPGLSAIAKRLAGPVGLLMTESPPAEVLAWFKTHARQDYARGGNKATETVTVPAGPVMIRTEPPETLPHNMEPQLRALGMPTELNRGVPTLLREYTVCKKGQVLTAESAQILKHLVIQMAEFRVTPLAYWTATTSKVIEVNGGIAIKAKSGSKTTRRTAKDVEMDDEDGEEEDGDYVDDNEDEDVQIDEGADEDDEDLEDEDEEAAAVSAGDKVTSSMMLPAGLA